MTGQENTSHHQDAPYVYFVSYAHGTGFGAIEVLQDEPVTSWRDIDGFAKLAAQGANVPPDRVVVLNFQLLRGPESVS